MSTFETSGWPNVYISPSEGNEKRDYSRLFGLKAEGLTAFAYNDVPELAEVIEYIINRVDLAERLGLAPKPAHTSDNDALWLVRLQAADLVLSVVDRARALGSSDDPMTLLTAYKERERSILAPELNAELVAPLVLTPLELDEPLELSEDVRLEKLDEATQLARARKHFSIEAVPVALSGAATHAVVITGVKIDNSSFANRMWRGRGPTFSFEKIDLVIECLRLVSLVPTGYAQVFVRPIGWADRWTDNLPPVVDVGVFRRYPTFFDDYGWLKKMRVVSANQLSILPRVVMSAQRADRPAQLALRRFSLADLRDQDDDKIVDACIGVEALLSKDNAEISHKIALRGAAALATHSTEPWDAKKAFDVLKYIYGRRSMIVHGTGSSKRTTYEIRGKNFKTSAVALLVLRDLLLSLLTSDHPWNIVDLDEEILLSLNRVND